MFGFGHFCIAAWNYTGWYGVLLHKLIGEKYIWLWMTCILHWHRAEAVGIHGRFYCHCCIIVELPAGKQCTGISWKDVVYVSLCFISHSMSYIWCKKRTTQTTRAWWLAAGRESVWIGNTLYSEARMGLGNMPRKPDAGWNITAGRGMSSSISDQNAAILSSKCSPEQCPYHSTVRTDTCEGRLFTQMLCTA